jgi:hypothetical protein
MHLDFFYCLNVADGSRKIKQCVVVGELASASAEISFSTSNLRLGLTLMDARPLDPYTCIGAAGVEKEHLFVSLSSLSGGSNYVHHWCISNKSGRHCTYKKLTSISIMVTLERQPPFKSRLVLFSAPLLLL